MFERNYYDIQSKEIIIQIALICQTIFIESSLLVVQDHQKLTCY